MAACGQDTGEAGGARAPCPLPGFPSLMLGGHRAGGRGAPVPQCLDGNGVPLMSPYPQWEPLRGAGEPPAGNLALGEDAAPGVPPGPAGGPGPLPGGEEAGHPGGHRFGHGQGERSWQPGAVVASSGSPKPPSLGLLSSWVQVWGSGHRGPLSRLLHPPWCAAGWHGAPIGAGSPQSSPAGISRSSQGATLLDGLSATRPVPFPVLSSARWEPRRYRASPWHPPRAPCLRWPHRVPGAEAVSREAPRHPDGSRDYRRCATCWPCTFLLRASGTGTNFSCMVPWRGQGPAVALGIAAPQDLSDHLSRRQGASSMYSLLSASGPFSCFFLS